MSLTFIVTAWFLSMMPPVELDTRPVTLTEHDSDDT